MEENIATSWNDLNERLYEDSWNDRLGRFRSSYAFRGMQNAGFDLTTSLVRLGGDYPRHEDDLLRNFRKYAYDHSAMGDSVWNWLALAQHHGLPTRLLDWTYSPYVALHFATADIELFGIDGIVWCIDYEASNRLLPNRLKSVLEETDSNVFTAEMLDGVARTLPDFDRLAEDEFVIFLEPPSLDDRIVNQYALFSLMSNPTSSLDHWLAQNPQLCRRIIIPASVKWEVRDKLDQANITERVLLPGLDGLSRWLKRYYSPRG